MTTTETEVTGPPNPSEPAGSGSGEERVLAEPKVGGGDRSAERGARVLLKKNPEKEPKAIPWTAIAALGIGLGTGLLAAFLFAWRADDQLQTLACAWIFSAAAVMSGGAVGFIFGIPKATAQTSPLAPPPEGPGEEPTDYQLNTNLQQISDWLTKVIVGVALTQLGPIRNGAADLFAAMAPALGGTDEATAFAGGITIYFSVFGFLMGWLAASLTLPLYLSRLPDLLRPKRSAR